MEISAQASIHSGVNFQSPLLHLKDFDLFSQAPFDIMHICLEGVMPHVLKCVVSDLLEKKYISQSFFHSLNLFPFEYHFKSNIPSKFSTISDFHQSAMQNYTTFFVTIFTLGSLSFPLDTSFDILILLLDIIFVLFSPCYSILYSPISP